MELHGRLAQHSPNGDQAFDLEVPGGATVRTIVRRLDIPEEMTGAMVVNDKSTELETVLNTGDRLTMIPPLAGVQSVC
jgi:molybdopterin converting factor small subunit